jgi:hypothetical protein
MAGAEVKVVNVPAAFPQPEQRASREKFNVIRMGEDGEGRSGVHQLGMGGI